MNWTLVLALMCVATARAFRSGGACIASSSKTCVQFPKHAPSQLRQQQEQQQRQQWKLSVVSAGRPHDSSWALQAVADASEDASAAFDVKAWFNPNTRGGVIVWCFLLVSLPVGVYNYLVSTGLEATTVGGYVGAIFVLLSNLLWASTYIFRVANKDMTYAKQLRDYENAVLQKRLEELADDEIDALMQEIEVEDPVASQ